MPDPTTHATHLRPVTGDAVLCQVLRDRRITDADGPDLPVPLVRERPRPPALPEPPLRCRIGWHRLTVVAVGVPWPAGAVQLASVTSMCRRDHCALLRHEQHRAVPRTVLQRLRDVLHALRTRLAGR